jgi:phage protein U
MTGMAANGQQALEMLRRAAGSGEPYDLVHDQAALSGMDRCS